MGCLEIFEDLFENPDFEQHEFLADTYHRLGILDHDTELLRKAVGLYETLVENDPNVPRLYQDLQEVRNTIRHIKKA